MKIEIKDLGFSYPDGSAIFEQITFSITQGSIICILGPNGAGKTTLLNCIANLAAPTQGQIFLDGQRIDKMLPQQVAKAIGYVPQMIVPSFDYSVLEYVVTGCAPHMGTFEKPKEMHYQRAREAIHAMGIDHIAEKSYMRISGGERQQVSIARSLAQKPAIILLDEPTAHLDFGNQIKVLKTIKRLSKDGYGVVMTTHNPDHALLLDDKIAVLDRAGHLRFGACQEIITEPFLKSLYGTDLRLVYDEADGRFVCAAPSLSI